MRLRFPSWIEPDPTPAHGSPRPNVEPIHMASDDLLTLYWDIVAEPLPTDNEADLERTILEELRRRDIAPII